MFELMCEIVDRHLTPVENNENYVVFWLNEVTPVTVGWQSLNPFMWAVMVDYLLAESDDLLDESLNF